MRRLVIHAICLFALTFYGPTVGRFAQAPPLLHAQEFSQESVYSSWLKLSLMGFGQAEIESTLVNVEAPLLRKVKHRLRLQVLGNLRRMNINNQIQQSTTPQELRIISEAIRTEIRFAGLEDDRHLRYMIRHQYGVTYY